MQIETFTYKIDEGWSVPSFPKLDSKNTLILTFCSPTFFNNPKPLGELKKAYPQSIFAGCSTSGEIFNEQVNDNSISVAVVKFDKSSIRMTTEGITDNAASFEIGKKLSDKLQGKDLKGIMVLSDGLIVNGSALVEGLKKNIASSIIVTGGLAGDGKDFKKTWVLKNDSPTSQCVSAIGFYGDHLQMGYGSKGGWDIFGPERLITRSQGNVLYEIDNQPALALYKKYLGDRAEGLPATGLLFPLAISEKSNSTDKVVRTILSVNEDDQSLTFAGDIPQGWYGQLMKANFDRLVEGAGIAGKSAYKNMSPDQDSLAIAISCVGRRLVLGERTEEELEAALDTLGKHPQLVGFYSYGEISPSGLSSCDLHNQTMTLTTIAEN